LSLVHWHDSLPSTMSEAARLASLGAPHGSVVAARQQTAGMGRHGRQWLSPPGHGLYCTFILRPAQPLGLTLGLGVAVREALAPHAGAELDLRWPNDVLWRERKLCGILARMEHGALLAGIGINLNQTEFPAGLRTPAVSLRQIRNQTFRAEDVLDLIAPSVEEVSALPLGEQLRLFVRFSSYAVGRRVRIENEGTALVGVTDGLDEAGFLMIRKEDGSREAVYAGSVRPLD